MLRAYKYRIYPTPEQQTFISLNVNAERFVYNLALETKVAAWKSGQVTLTRFDLCKQVTELKEDAPWLKGAFVGCLQHAVFAMCSDYQRFFDGHTFPSFKSKRKSPFSCHFPNCVKVDFEGGCIRLPKGHFVPAVFDRRFEGKIKTTTITKTSTGKYFVSVLVDTNHVVPEREKNETVGIDLGIKHLAILSTGEKIENPKFLNRQQPQLRRLHKSMRRKKKGSNNYNKAKLKLALAHERIANKRKDYLHKLSTRLVNDNQVICLETLQVNFMRQFGNLGGAISDASWGMLNQFLEYKAEWYGSEIRRVSTFAATTKTCNSCGHKNKNLTLNDRVWTCEKCGAEHDRDVNAAKNVKDMSKVKRGKRISLEPVELQLGCDAEAGSRKAESQNRHRSKNGSCKRLKNK